MLNDFVVISDTAVPLESFHVLLGRVSFLERKLHRVGTPETELGGEGVSLEFPRSTKYRKFTMPANTVDSRCT
jgi:hypothetical protein